MNYRVADVAITQKHLQQLGGISGQDLLCRPATTVNQWTIGMIPFGTYARYYDVLYRDKNYTAESEYVARAIRSVAADASSILELGCGTGRHGRLLANRGFHVHGIERSLEMAALAKSASQLQSDAIGSFSCDIGDVRQVKLERTFDAVIALFHVISYQTTNSDLNATFAAASHHLAPGGVFLFDVWHGPAVLKQQPERRVKTVIDNDLRIVRTAQPRLDVDNNVVEIIYDIECENRYSGDKLRFDENHRVRYLFPEEIERLAADNDFELITSEEFLTGNPPSPTTWGVAYLLRK
jgi:SAM-dependent methyltransferase